MKKISETETAFVKYEARNDFFVKKSAHHIATEFNIAKTTKGERDILAAAVEDYINDMGEQVTKCLERFEPVEGAIVGDAECRQIVSIVLIALTDIFKQNLDAFESKGKYRRLSVQALQGMCLYLEKVTALSECSVFHRRAHHSSMYHVNELSGAANNYAQNQLIVQHGPMRTRPSR